MTTLAGFRDDGGFDGEAGGSGSADVSVRRRERSSWSGGRISNVDGGGSGGGDAVSEGRSGVFIRGVAMALICEGPLRVV